MAGRDPIVPDIPARPSPRRRATSGHEARERRRRRITYALLIGSAILMVNALVGDDGYLARLTARHDADVTAQDLQRVRADNARLRDYAGRLQHDPATIEDEARRNLGLIKPGETLIVIHDAAPHSTDGSR